MARPLDAFNIILFTLSFTLSLIVLTDRSDVNTTCRVFDKTDPIRNKRLTMDVDDLGLRNGIYISPDREPGDYDCYYTLASHGGTLGSGHSKLYEWGHSRDGRFKQYMKEIFIAVMVLYGIGMCFNLYKVVNDFQMRNRLFIPGPSFEESLIRE